jgi:hypothetical protein
MSDLGRRLRHTLDEVAPPADLDRIIAHEPSLPFWRVGRALAYAAVLVAVVGVTGFLLTRVGSDDTAVDSSVTTVEGTVTTLGEGLSVDDLVIPIVDPPSTEPLAGTWTKTNLGLDGLLVMPIDVVWDGEAFYLLQRVAFGDMRIWRSVDGLDWTELPSIGTFTIAEGGPLAFARYRDGLVAGGHVGDEAAIWILDGTRWTETRLGVDAFVSDVAVIGDSIVAVGTTVVSGTIPTERHAHLWTSVDGVVWQEQDPSVFGELSYAVGVVEFDSRFVAVANRSSVSAEGREEREEPLILSSAEGSAWQEVDVAIGVETLRAVEGGDLLRLSSVSSVYVTGDGDSWGQILIDRSDLDPRLSVATGWLSGRLLLLGGVERPDERFGDVPHPHAWSYRGSGEWAEVGSGLGEFGPGMIDQGVDGDGVFVATGRQATVGSPDDGWALYTFVADPESVTSPIRECGGEGVEDGFTGPMAGLPDAVDAARRDIVLLATDCDLGGLAYFAAAGSRPFEYPLAHRFATPETLWSALQEEGMRPIGALVQMLSGPFTTTDTGNGTEYWWPAPADYSNVPYEPWVQISEDGEWLSYVIPDRLLPEEWLGSSDWTVESGDLLVANDSGVLTGRDELVWWAVTGPVEVALPDLTGGIVFTTPDSTSIWRIRGPGAPVEEVFSADGIAADDAGPPRLYQVVDRSGELPGPLVIFTIGVVEPITGWTVDEVWALPLEGADALLLAPLNIETPGEGGVTGLGWLDAEGVFVMSEQNDGGSTLSLWDSNGEVAWPSNPESYESRCSGDPGYNDCLESVAVIPGTSRIAYVVHDLPGFGTHNDERVTELVIYDLATESEVERVTILDGPGYSTREWFVHASRFRVALTWLWAEQNEDGQWYYPTASAIYDIDSGELFALPFDGMVSIVP